MSQLTNYIQKELDKGFSKKLITEKLVQAGYDKQEIKESFASLKKGEPLLKRELDHVHYDVHVQWSKWVFPLLALGILLFMGYLVFLYATGESTGEPTLVVPTDCDTIVDAEEKDLCLLGLAEQGEDVCPLVTNNLYRAACHSAVWETDPCLLEFFHGGDMEQCLWDLAMETGDVDYCEQKIIDDHECYFALALAANDASLCGSKLQCYQLYAVEMQDRDVCLGLEEVARQEACFAYYDIPDEEE